MPHKLELNFLGTLDIHIGGKQAEGFRSLKAQALLCYLAVSERAHSRSALSGLLWGDTPEEQARASLRQALSNLTELCAGCLTVTRQSIAFERNYPYSLDTERFEAAAARLAVTPGLVELNADLELYRGDFLEGFVVRNAPDFETWMLGMRARYRELALQAFNAVAVHHMESGDVAQAILYCHRLLEIEPWHEDARRRLMQLLAQTGQRTAALEQYRICQQLLADELGIEPDEATQALYEEIKSNTRVVAMPAASRPSVLTPRANLPHQLSPFVGRETELAALDELMSQRDVRLITILGAGGMGKTRLALAAAERHLADARFAQGIYFVALAPLSDAQHIILALAEALSFSLMPAGDGHTPQHQLLEYLRAKSMLLIFDNFEHLLDGADLVTQILRAAPEVQVLVTSRERLRLQGEHLVSIQGLDCSGVAGSAAVQLFLQSARQLRPNRNFSSDELTHIISICRLVGGMPLGIDLAASWLEVLSPAEIATEIRRSLDFLEAEQRGSSEDHHSIRAIFNSTWRRLHQAEQEIFACLAIFRGGFTREAAEQVVGASLRQLGTLAGKALIQHEGGRYTLHELLRQFAEEKLLANSQRAEESYDRLCTYFTTFLQRQEVHLKGPQQPEAMSAIEAEIDNIRTAWHWAVAHRQIEALDRSLEALLVFYETKSWFQEGLTVFGLATDALDEDELAGREELLLARILARQGWMLAAIDQKIARGSVREKARTCCERSLHIFNKLGERAETAVPLYCLGLLALVTGDAEQALQLFQQALTLFTEQDDAWKMIIVLYGLGYGNNFLGNYAQANTYFKQAIAVCEETGDVRSLGSLLCPLAASLEGIGEYQQAKEVAQRALAVNTAVDYQFGVCWALKLLGEVAQDMGDFETAQQYATAALAIVQELGLTHLQDAPLINLGYAAVGLGDYQQARSYFCTVLKSHQQAGTLNASWFVGHAAAGLARVLAREGRTAQAVELLNLALHHPAAWQYMKDEAATLLAELAPEMTSQTRPPARPPEVVIAESLREA